MTTPESVTCPSCKMPWVLIAGNFPYHTVMGAPCAMSNQPPSSWPLPLAPHFEPIEIPPNPAPEAIKKPGRKVRSDKGTKRGPRKTGGEAHAASDGLQAAPEGPSSQAPEQVAARPQLTRLEAILIAKEQMAKAEAARSALAPDAPRAGYVATAPDFQPLIHATYDEADDAATEALRGAAERIIIYWVTPFEEISNGLIRKRLGRVRRRKP